MREDSIPTPGWLLPFIEGWFDPYPLNGNGPVEPPASAKVWVNPGFSRKAAAIENAIRWHQEGHMVACYLPVETTTQYAKRLLQYGVRRLYFERRPYEGCRGIEILVLTGPEEKPSRTEGAP
jgi:hypothetical protein